MIHYVDNESARYALIKGNSPTYDSAALAAAFWTREAELACFSWFEWVPSPSNIADDPSRGRAPGPLRKGTAHQLAAKEVELPPSFEADLAWEWSTTFCDRNYDWA